MKKPYFIGVYNKSVWLTYLSAVFAVIGVFFSMNVIDEGILDIPNMTFLVLCLIGSGICDMFDGTVARHTKRNDVQKAFGIQIDSLADTVAFVVCPAIAMLNICGFTLYNMIFATLYILAGIIRLGWFNVVTDGNTKYFQGLPVTSMAILLPFYFTLVKVYLHYGKTKLYDEFTVFLPILFIITAFFFVFNIRIKKPNLKQLVILALIGLLAVILLIVI